MKYKLPNHTQVPNDFIDKDMKNISGNEAKVYLVICRKTIGWHKEADYISISQIVELTGISNRVVIKCINNLAEKKFIAKERTKHITRYTINFESQNDEESQDEAIHRVTKRHLQSDETSQVEAKTYDETSHTKESIKKTHKKESIYDRGNPLSLTTIYLYEQIMKHSNPPTYKKKKPNLDNWYIDIDRLHRIDGVSVEDIRKTIDFAVKDQFWKINILSADKLRKHFDKLFLAMTKIEPENETWADQKKRLIEKGLL